MAVKAVRALLTVQLQSAWNRMRRESGLAGPAATGITVAIAMALVLLPGVFALGLGRELGTAMAGPDGDSAVASWCALQAIFTVLFALFGSLRFRPALSLASVQRFPLTRAEVAIAELPAALFEVFPLLGLLGIVTSNLGLLLTMPAMAAAIALMTALNILSMLSLIICAASARRLLMRWPGARIAAAVGLAAALGGGAWSGLGRTLSALLSSFLVLASIMPAAHGYDGVAVVLRAGDLGQGAMGAVVASTLTVALMLLAAVTHGRALATGAWSPRSSASGAGSGRYRGPSREVAALFFEQLTSARAVRITMLMPLLIAGGLAAVGAAIKQAVAAGETVPEAIAAVRLDGVPLLALVLFLGVGVNAPVWMNQFAWDRSAIRALMLLPITPREILVGKFLGLLRFTILQGAVCGLGILAVYRPTAREVAGAVAAALVTFVVTCGVGQSISLRAPRAAPAGSIAQLPLYLSWIPAALLIALGFIVERTWALGERVGHWCGPVLIWILLAGAVLAWWRFLPELERSFGASRDRLMSMSSGCCE
ncbi:MAG: hypothetical protein HYV63_30590 [Candidatus Schekmanbacteria bacterium]|nr:hypothetical protein [Candidatus Schekmanbacteria bacterium]